MESSDIFNDFVDPVTNLIMVGKKLIFGSKCLKIHVPSKTTRDTQFSGGPGQLNTEIWVRFHVFLVFSSFKSSQFELLCFFFFNLFDQKITVKEIMIEVPKIT